MHHTPPSLSVDHQDSQFVSRHRRPTSCGVLTLSLWLVLCGLGVTTVRAQGAGGPAVPGPTVPGTVVAKPGVVKRVLLLGTMNDGHPHATHEYLAGMRVLKKCLDQSPGVRAEVVQVDDLWRGGPDLLDQADGAVVFVTEGAKWLQQEPDRLAAFQRLAHRGGGLTCLHWGMGCKDAENIEKYVQLFGGCHGGPDRKYKVVELQPTLANPSHPINTQVQPPKCEEEFYYRLKFPKSTNAVTPLWQIATDHDTHTVAWAWDRADKEQGRSFGFSGLHFHKNWSQPAYRRLMTQGVLWTLKLPIPAKGAPVDVSETDLKLDPPPPKKAAVP